MTIPSVDKHQHIPAAPAAAKAAKKPKASQVMPKPPKAPTKTNKSIRAKKLDAHKATQEGGEVSKTQLLKAALRGLGKSLKGIFATAAKVLLVAAIITAYVVTTAIMFSVCFPAGVAMTIGGALVGGLFFGLVVWPAFEHALDIDLIDLRFRQFK